MVVVNTHLRQLDILKPELHSRDISIIGAGATGSMLCFLLTKMGMNNIRLWDFDCVEEMNPSNQLFKISDLNKFKAEQTSRICEEFTGVKIRFANCKYENQPLSGIVVIATDTMESRKKIFSRCQISKDVQYVIDPRSGPEYGRVYSIDMRLDCERKFWEKSWYSDASSEQTNCTETAIAYGVGFLTSIITNQIKRIMMGQNYFREIIFDMNSYMMLTK